MASHHNTSQCIVMMNVSEQDAADDDDVEVEKTVTSLDNVL